MAKRRYVLTVHKVVEFGDEDKEIEQLLRDNHGLDVPSSEAKQVAMQELMESSMHHMITMRRL